MQPIAVGQVGETFGAVRIRTVALGTVVHEQALTHRHGFGVLRQLLGRLGIKGGVQGLQICIGFGHLRLVLPL